jgi:hypothetical protein
MSLNIFNRGRKLVLFEYFHHSYWDANPDDVPEIPKCLISIWDSTGINSLLSVPKGMTHKTIFYVESVVPDLVEQVCQETQRKTL